MCLDVFLFLGEETPGHIEELGFLLPFRIEIFLLRSVGSTEWVVVACRRETRPTKVSVSECLLPAFLQGSKCWRLA